MKRLSIFLAILLLFAAGTVTSAQGLIFKGGLNYTNVDLEGKGFRFEDGSGWHFGAGYQTGSVLGFSLQPELLYSVQGVKLVDIDRALEVQKKSSYLELPVNIQWGIDLIAAKPFIMLTPKIAYNIKNWANKEASNSLVNQLINEKTNLEYGIGVGAGLNIWKLQITAKYEWIFGHVSSIDEYLANAKEANKSIGNLQISVGFCF
mgnify:FL=1